MGQCLSALLVSQPEYHSSHGQVLPAGCGYDMTALGMPATLTDSYLQCYWHPACTFLHLLMGGSVYLTGVL